MERYLTGKGLFSAEWKQQFTEEFAKELDAAIEVAEEGAPAGADRVPGLSLFLRHSRSGIGPQDVFAAVLARFPVNLNRLRNTEILPLRQAQGQDDKLSCSG